MSRSSTLFHGLHLLHTLQCIYELCSPVHALSFSALFQHTKCCFLHILLIFPSTRYLGFPFSAVICLVAHQILQVSVLICPFLHQQVTVCLSSLAIPPHSAQAVLSCFLQTVSTGQTLCLLSGAMPDNKYGYSNKELLFC